MKSPEYSVSIIILAEEYGAWADSAKRVFQLLTSSAIRIGMGEKIQVCLYDDVIHVEQFLNSTKISTICLICHISELSVAKLVQKHCDNHYWIFVSGGYISLHSEFEPLSLSGRLICFSTAYGKENNFVVWLHSWRDLSFAKSSFRKTKESLLSGSTILTEYCLDLAGRVGFLAMILESYLMTIGIDTKTMLPTNKPQIIKSETEVAEWLTHMLESDISFEEIELCCSRIDSVIKKTAYETYSFVNFVKSLEASITKIMLRSGGTTISSEVIFLLKDLRKFLTVLQELMKKDSDQSFLLN